MAKGEGVYAARKRRCPFCKAPIWLALVKKGVTVLGSDPSEGAAYPHDCYMAHGAVCAGAPAFCGVPSDGNVMDCSVSMTHEDGRDLTCPMCRAAWLAIPPAPTKGEE